VTARQRWFPEGKEASVNAKLDSSRIVVGVDDSGGSRSALAWAIEEATLRGATIDLVHAWRPMYHTHVDEVGDADADAGLTSQAHGDGLLASALGRARAAAPGLQVRGQLLKGRPSAVLLKAALGARMLVVGSRGLGGFSGLLLGSVGLHVVADAPGPVVVVRRFPHREGPVIAGIDGSAESKTVLAAALEEAALRGVPLIVTYVVYVHSRAEGVPDPDRALAAAVEDATAKVERLLAESTKKYPDVQVAAAFPTGHAAKVLLTESARAQLLVVGSRGGGGFVGMKLGSITHAVAQHAHCPVMVVRSRAASRHHRSKA
jgi:nucleotide-binding universal stress UspA family protein